MPIAALLGPWELAVIVLLLAIVFICLFWVPWRVAVRLSAGDVAESLRQIHKAAGQASERVQNLNDELAASEELGRWRSIMQTALGTVIGLAGGFLGPWVGSAESLGCGLLRAAIVIVPASAFVLVVSTVLFPYIDRRISRKLESKQTADLGAS